MQPVTTGNGNSQSEAARWRRGRYKVFGWKCLNKLCYITEGRKATLDFKRLLLFIYFFQTQLFLCNSSWIFFCVNRVGSQCLSTQKTRKDWKSRMREGGVFVFVSAVHYLCTEGIYLHANIPFHKAHSRSHLRTYTEESPVGKARAADE